MAWDVDERAPERVAALRDVLERYGFADAAIVTEGSDAGRSKVLLFTRPVQQAAAVELAAAILDQARAEPGWGIERPGTVEARPLDREGGLLRIGGRNVARHGPLERIFALSTGEPIALSQARIVDLDLQPVPQPIPVPRVAPYIAKLLESGLPWPVAGTAGVRRDLARIAIHAARTGQGRAAFEGWVERIRAKSPWLDDPSPKNRDRRGALAPARVAAIWEGTTARLSRSQRYTTSAGAPEAGGR